MKLRDRTARRAVLRVLHRIQGGHVDLIDVDGTNHSLGPLESELRTTIRIKDPRAWRGPLGGGLGLGRTYVEGWWECDDLVALYRIAARGMESIDAKRRRLHPFTGRAKELAGRVPLNSRIGSRQNIAAHYDLGNNLFETFLDETMMYSCGIYERPDATLEEAQEAKLERICQKLELGPDDHLLEIGTGWGGLARHAASRYGCKVTTTTISAEQHAFATQRISEAGLSDRVTVLLDDYRDLNGTYDKLVSIEMVEAVGWQYFDQYFKHCSDLLVPGGLFLMQAILIDDSLFEIEKASKSFANTMVFPGGCLPSLASVSDSIARVTEMHTTDVHDITADYVLTLAEWDRRFSADIPELEKAGYDDRFQRLWHLYLNSCEAGFAERRITDVQMLFAKTPAKTGLISESVRSRSRATATQVNDLDDHLIPA